jgi:TonB family protein
MIKFKVIFLLLFPVTLIGQVTKKLTISHKNPWYTEVYYVLKSDQKIKHGIYQMLGYKNGIIIDGYFLEGQKDSIWQEYYWNLKQKSKGAYTKDNKIGIWEYYSYNGEMDQKFDHTKNELIFDASLEKQKQTEFLVVNGADTIRTKLEHGPIFIGGSALRLDALNNNLKFPLEAMERRLSGTVLISFIVGKDGKTTNHKVKKGIGHGCDEEALRVVQLIPNDWIPGQLDGQLVNVEYIQPVGFKSE